MPTVAENLAAYATRLKYEDLPSEVIHSAKRIIMDTVGCAFGGYDSEPGKIARNVAGLVSSSQPATILCSGQKTSADQAAFANGVMIRYLDFNDGYVSKGGGHPSDSIAALLSSADVAHASGRDLIVATVLAYEIFCRICDVWSSKTRGIDGVTVSGIAGVAAAARLYGLTRQQIVEAINIMIAGNIAINQTRLGNVSNWKACAAGHADRNAICAVQLAAQGMTGPPQIFEGRSGFFKIVSQEPLDFTLGNEDGVFRIMRCHLKAFPLGNFLQTVVTAALEAQALVGDVREIAEVQIRTSQKALYGMADPAKWRPRNRETADHSMPYTAAVALTFGTIDEGYFEERYFLHDKELLDLMDRIKCGVSEEADRRDAETYLCELDVITRSGERKPVRVEYHRGHWRNPMSDAEVETKFRSLVADMLPPAHTDALVEQLWKLENLPDVGTLMHMTAHG